MIFRESLELLRINLGYFSFLSTEIKLSFSEPPDRERCYAADVVHILNVESLMKE